MYTATFARLFVYLSVLCLAASASAKPTRITKNRLTGSVAKRAVQSSNSLKQLTVKRASSHRLVKRAGPSAAVQLTGNADTGLTSSSLLGIPDLSAASNVVANAGTLGSTLANAGLGIPDLGATNLLSSLTLGSTAATGNGFPSDVGSPALQIFGSSNGVLAAVSDTASTSSASLTGSGIVTANMPGGPTVPIAPSVGIPLTSLPGVTSPDSVPGVSASLPVAAIDGVSDTLSTPSTPIVLSANTQTVPITSSIGSLPGGIPPVSDSGPLAALPVAVNVGPGVSASALTPTTLTVNAAGAQTVPSISDSNSINGASINLPTTGGSIGANGVSTPLLTANDLFSTAGDLTTTLTDDVIPLAGLSNLPGLINVLDAKVQGSIASTTQQGRCFF